jgi:hypothetical protein
MNEAARVQADATLIYPAAQRYLFPQ